MNYAPQDLSNTILSLANRDHQAFLDDLIHHGEEMFMEVMRLSRGDCEITFDHVVEAFRLGNQESAEFLLSRSLRGFWMAKEDANIILWKLGDHAISTLRLVIENGQDEGLRVEAVRTVAGLQHPDVPNVLSAALNDSSSEVRTAAAHGLRDRPNPASAKVLMEMLNSGRPWFERSAAAEALGKLGSRDSLQPLIELLVDEEVKASAALALGRLGYADAVFPLITALHHKGFAEAIVALGMIRHPAAIRILIGYLAQRHSWSYDVAVEALGQIGSDAIKPLMEGLRDSNHDLREGCILALSRIGALHGDARVVEPLISMWSDKNGHTMEVAMIALGKLGSMALEATEKVLANPKTSRRHREVLEHVARSARHYKEVAMQNEL